MLTENQQKLILKVYLKHITTGDGFIDRADVNELYGYRSSFLKSIKYLVDSGYVERVELKVNVVKYKLSITGQFLARVLCALADNPNEIKALKFTLRI